ncbi:MAG: Minf_1886 family protein [Gemmataceae bacterium]
MDAKILEAVRGDSRYAYEAYEFVCDAVTFTQDHLGRSPRPNDPDDANYHVGAEELLRGTCELALREFGMMAPLVFSFWGIHETDDIGNIVFNLIHLDRLSQSDQDDPEDFHDAFNIEQALMDGFQLTIQPQLSRKVAER